GDPILFIHGNPTSAYIWRNIIPHVTPYGRAIAVDLIGMGKSDKPDIDYGFTDSYAYLEAFIEKLNLKNITLVVQDWGSGLGFHYAHQHSENIKGIAFMEAMYKKLDWRTLPFSSKLGLTMMQSKLGSFLMFGVANSFVNNMLPQWTERPLSAQEMAVYREPYPTIQSRKAMQVFPRDVPVRGKPTHTDSVVENYHRWLQQTPIPKLCFYATPGMLIPIEDVPWIRNNFPNITMIDIGKGTHFVQEDSPHLIGSELAK
ncbi:MAG: haloalkane dehalogenase, partial [Chloroflexota bacterium]